MDTITRKALDEAKANIADRIEDAEASDFAYLPRAEAIRTLNVWACGPNKIVATVTARWAPFADEAARALDVEAIPFDTAMIEQTSPVSYQLTW